MSGPAELYVNFLTEEGYRPTVDGDGDVQFKIEGGLYYIDVETDDPPYFRVVFPNFWSIENPDELTRAYGAADHATASTKVAKVYLRPDLLDTIAAVEIYVDPPEQFKTVFPRTISALQSAVGVFRDRMRGEPAAAS